jgi:peptidoglycan-associated lipoprotein
MSVFTKFAGIAFSLAIVAGCSSTGGDANDEANAAAQQDDVAVDTVEDNNVSGTQQLEEAASAAGYIVYFGFDDDALTSESVDILKAHAALLAENGNSVVLEGHADERGTREYNMALGERRAKSVQAFLVAEGVAASQIEVVSYGEERPSVDGHDEAAWAKNRRVEIRY